MNYMGGKHRQGTVIAALVAGALQPGCTYIEPFCGALGVASRLAASLFRPSRMILSDIHAPIIRMWTAAMQGWIPPDVVSEQDYQRVRAANDPDDPMTAFCGFGLSFGGKYWGGYARNGAGIDYVLNARRSLLAKASVLAKASAEFRVCDYTAYAPVTGHVFYLDPPYAGRTRPGARMTGFDHAKFWSFAAALARRNVVFVTEFAAPPDWRSVYSFGDTVTRHHISRGKDGTEERMFVHRHGLGSL